MGYACPVCETPQADAVHLANHLGITAVARGGDHEDWLDEHVPGWNDLDEAALAERVVDHADETDYPQFFEDTTGGERARGYDHADRVPTDLPADVDEGSLLDGEDDDADGRAEDILEEARELTRRRRETESLDDRDEHSETE